MDYMLGVSKGVAVGAFTVVAGSVGFTLSVLSVVVGYLLPLSSNSPPVSTAHIESKERSPRSSVGSFLSQTTSSSRASGQSVPSPIRLAHSSTSSGALHHVKFRENLVVPPVSDIQLRQPRARSNSGVKGERIRSLSPIAGSPNVPTPPDSAHNSIEDINNGASNSTVTQAQENVASTSAVQLESGVVDPLPSPTSPTGCPKTQRALRLLGKGFVSAKLERRKKLERSVSNPSTASTKEKGGSTVLSDGEDESGAPSTLRRRERKGLGFACPERRKTLPPEVLEKMGDAEPEDERKINRSRSVDRCLNRRREPSLPPPLPRTNPYEAPYFFPPPGSPEAQDYVRKVKEERLRASKASNTNVRSYFHQPPSTPSTVTTPSPASAASSLPPLTPPASGAASPRRSSGNLKRLPPTPEDVGEALAVAGQGSPLPLKSPPSKGILKRNKTSS